MAFGTDEHRYLQNQERKEVGNWTEVSESQAAYIELLERKAAALDWLEMKATSYEGFYTIELPGGLIGAGRSLLEAVEATKE